MRALLSTVLICLTFNAICQTQFERVYTSPSTDDECQQVLSTNDGGYILLGNSIIDSSSSNWNNIYLVKVNMMGDTLWTQTYGNDSLKRGFSIEQTEDDGFIIVGITQNLGGVNSDVFLFRTDSSGDVLWFKTYGGSDNDFGYALQICSDSGYIVTGATSSFGAGSQDVYLIRTDKIGDTLWTNAFGGSGVEVGLSVRQTLDGGFIIAGATMSFGAGS
ncbi:MAG: hypothetical protein JKY52_06740, partial [Flavobacteriales bacterium]|nr:hypothetical protein [Flavobacteriales bacterium]